MSGGIPFRSDAEREALAAEYVLGTLSAHEAALVLRAVATDPVLAEAVADWDLRLAPLTRLAPPEAPPADLWDRIERRIAPELGAARRPGLSPRQARRGVSPRQARRGVSPRQARRGA